ncbi:TonB-dependent receptor domain-containing protein, partial [Enterococcus lactis]|uniref:TonB-dependent receptor domain-containing protein n=1 Tax=Enterococcus lactis TaxID=357441 RepID=UPI0039081343
GTPKYSGNLHLRYTHDVFDKELTLGVTGAYRGAFPPGNGPQDANREGEAYTTWDLSVALQLSKAWSVRAFANNVFDEQANLSF